MRKSILIGFCAFFAALLPAAPASADADYYIAAGGESVNAIAEAYNLDGELVALMNDLSGDKDLRQGQLLRLPQTPFFNVTISEGDTLYSLARTYNVSFEEIAKVNGLQATDTIYAGQSLLIPLSEESAVSSGKTVEKIDGGVAYASRAGDAYLWPVIGPISSPYGQRDDGFHFGLDIAVDSGTAICAAAAGTVIEAGWKNDSYGYTVMLDHGNGRQTLYAHASILVVDEGDWVEAGQVIAYSGSTGNSTGPHLHFEIRLDGTCVDPLLYLRDRAH
jgi:murein DD-endopeptidase MepM/ murein hydrolase activator NlpD